MFLRWFDRFILLAILLNSIVLALYDYSDRNSTSSKNQTLDLIGNILTVIFLTEAILKILAMGFFFHPKSYLRNMWNVMDLTIVITG